MTKDEALALALHALHTKGEHHPRVYEAIYAIQTVLAQPPPPEQEQALKKLADLGQEIEQEPVAYYHPHKGFYWAKPTYISAPTVVDVPPVPLYVKWITAQCPWQGLTDEEIWNAVSRIGTADSNVNPYITIKDARAIEAKLKEKNT